jgi:hypothetical protein
LLEILVNLTDKGKQLIVDPLDAERNPTSWLEGVDVN